LVFPCRLGFGPGRTLALELFLDSTDTPLPVRGTIKNVIRISNRENICYIADIEFDHLSGPDARRIASFMSESQLHRHRHMSV